MRLVRIEASAGLYTTKDVHSAIRYGDDKPWGKNVRGTYFLGVSFYSSDIVELSLAFGYQHDVITNEIRMYDTSEFYQSSLGYSIDHSKDINYYTLIPEIRFNWIRTNDDLFEFYSTLCLGLTVVSERHPENPALNEFYPLPGFHINALGMRFGNKFGGFIEFGVGTKGLINAGLSYRFQ